MARNSLKNVAKLIARANTTVPVEQQFLTDLKRSIELNDEKNARKPSQTYKPSSMHCIRSMYYTVTGAEPEVSSNYVMVGICESGTDRHERIQNAISHMKDVGIDCTYVDVGDYVKSRNLPLEVVEKCGNETKLYDKVRNISFLCDGIIKYQNKYYIVEFKTESIYKWSGRSDVDPKHYNQARSYSLELGIDDVLFIYINRDMCDMKAFMYHVTQKERDSIEDLVATCTEFVKKNTVPPIPENVTAKSCQYCNYKNLCKGDSNEEGRA